MTASSRAEFAAVVRQEPLDLGRACLLIGAETEPTVDVAAGLTRLDELAAGVRPLLADGATAADALRTGLGGFSGTATDYQDVRASLLSEVLRRRRGLPILLSVVWLEVARRLDLPAHGVGLPGHFVVSVDGQLADPFSGGTALTRADVAGLVLRATGRPLAPEHLEPVPPTAILLRLLTNIRALGARTMDARMQLWAVELSLLLPSRSLTLRRERGELLGRLGDFLAGAAELELYADAVESLDPQAAEAARSAARMARARLN